MSEWSNKYSKCQSCSTSDWKHKAKGLCVKCYPIKRKIAIVEKWDLNDNPSLKPIGGFDSMLITQIIKSDKFINSKMEILRQLKNRLLLYQNCFNPINVDGMSIERLLACYSELLLGDKGKIMFHGACSKYDNKFSQKQMNIIFKDLNLILAQKRFELNLNSILLNY